MNKVTNFLFISLIVSLITFMVSIINMNLVIAIVSTVVAIMLILALILLSRSEPIKVAKLYSVHVNNFDGYFNMFEAYFYSDAELVNYCDNLIKTYEDKHGLLNWEYEYEELTN